MRAESVAATGTIMEAICDYGYCTNIILVVVIFTIQNDLKGYNIMAEKFNPRCHIGEVHGIYTIVDVFDEKDKYGHWIYKCICNECGFEKDSHYGSFTGTCKATVCTHLRANGEYISYGYVWKNKRLKRILRGMIARCYNADDKNYQWYGEIGIRICEQWLKEPATFEEWAMLSGYADNLTIDRIDATKDYRPENCRWIPLKENSRRAGKVNWIDIDGCVLTGKQWAKKLHIGANTINTSIREHGVDKTKELIMAMLKEPPSTKHRKSHQTWFSVYGIQV
jgi:hypothetical protein